MRVLRGLVIVIMALVVGATLWATTALMLANQQWVLVRLPGWITARKWAVDQEAWLPGLLLGWGVALGLAFALVAVSLVGYVRRRRLARTNVALERELLRMRNQPLEGATLRPAPASPEASEQGSP